jgi:hypothetical protein
MFFAEEVCLILEFTVPQRVFDTKVLGIQIDTAKVEII